MKRLQVLLGAVLLALSAGGIAAESNKAITVKRGSELPFKLVRPGVERATVARRVDARDRALRGTSRLTTVPHLATHLLAPSIPARG